MRSSRLYIAEGIVLKRRNVGEADRILTIFTKQYGKIRVLAKGIRRITSRRAGHVEVFNHVILTLHARENLDIVTEAQTKTGNIFAQSDTGRIGYAYSMCELIDQLLPERQTHEDIFMLLVHSLSALQINPDPAAWQSILSDFVHQLLWTLGFLSHARRLEGIQIQPYIESITERRLRSWPLIARL